MLEMKELVKRYGNFTAVDHLTLTVPDGSIYGFVGPMAPERPPPCA